MPNGHLGFKIMSCAKAKLFQRQPSEFQDSNPGPIGKSKQHNIVETEDADEFSDYRWNEVRENES